jgi:cell division protein FtsB
MYIIFLIFVTASLVATAAYFSVIGIASMFAYNYVPALIMGTTLEAGKISVAVYLYRYWRLLPDGFRALLVAFLVTLMFITSVGIFGFLSQGYQKTAEEYRLITLELTDLEREFSEKRQREAALNRQIEVLPSDSVQNKVRLAREFGDELAEIRDRNTKIEPRIQELRKKRLSFESHIGPIAYVARMIGVPQDNMVFFAILMLVFVADPLAVTLTIACNMALIRFWDIKRPRFRARAEHAGPGLLESMVDRARSMAMLAYRETFEQEKKPGRHRLRFSRKPVSGRSKKRARR